VPDVGKRHFWPNLAQRGRVVRILFWGTPNFAVPSLRALAEEGHDIVGVVTQPDRPSGRGRKLRGSAVKRVALEENSYPVLSPERPRGESFMESVRELAPDLSVVVAYGHIISREVLDLPARGSINVHASLLPQLRGAAPINWAIVRGMELTGVTVMRMVEEMDAGPILFQLEEPVGLSETASELTARLSEIGAEALVETLAMLQLGASEECEQDHDLATFAPKIDRATARVDWAIDGPSVANHIRGMDEVPGAWSLLGGVPVKLFKPEVRSGGSDGSSPGVVLRADPDAGLLVASGEGTVTLGEVQPAGRRRMLASDWIRGRRVVEGDRFE
jgi:methionyl-tRNA formyltransferase